MKWYPCKALSMLTAAAGILLPASLPGMQELLVVPLSDQQGPSQLAPELQLAPVSAPISLPVPGPSDQVNGEGVEEAEAMLRGPVHEAFAEQFNQDPIPGLVVPKQPPEPIEELPPDVRPDGRQIVWISGYWAWDDDDEDFFWVSGIWREVPQGFRWLPGYWTEVETGWQWVSGTWIPEVTEEIQYVQTAPPESLELGPVGLAPSQEHIWIPGCWNWNHQSYAWRPGYWSTGYSNWIWVPARHVWTPRGYLNCNGYWDYPLDRRGLLFAPYRCRRSAHWNRSSRFTPQVVIAINQLHWNLWVRPRSCHYYFGDYYGPRYASTGFHPWHQFQRQPRQCDPLYSYFSRRSDGGNVSFYDQVNGRFNHLTSHADQRPVRTLNHRDGREPSRLNNNEDVSPLLGSTLQEHIREAGNTRFVRLEEDQRIALETDRNSLRQLVDQRREVENRARPETTRRRHQTHDSVGHVLTEDQPEADRRDKPSGFENRDSGERRDLSEFVRPPVSKVDEHSDRLRLPPVVRHGSNKEVLSNKGSSSNVKDSESRPPGSPVTRGERPRGVNGIVNRERNPVGADSHTDGSQKGHTRNADRDHAARPGEQADDHLKSNTPQQAENSSPFRDRRPDVLRNDARRTEGATKKSPPQEAATQAGKKVIPDTGTLRRQVPAPARSTGNVSEATKAGANGTVRSAVERSNSRPAVTSPPPRVEREARPPAAAKLSGDSVPRQVNLRGSTRNETRAAPPSKPAAEKIRRAEPPPAARSPREQVNPGAGGGERRKKK